MSELKQAGLTIDTAGKLYKVNSRGVFNNAVYNVIAYIDLPIKPEPVKPGKNPPDEAPPPAAEEAQSTTPGDGKTPDSKEEKPKPVELLMPRVIEMRLE